MTTMRSCIVVEVIRESQVNTAPTGDPEVLQPVQRLYRFEIPIGAPFTEAFSVTHEFGSQIEQMAKNAEAMAKAQADPQPVA